MGEPLQTFGRAREVGAPEVAGARRRAIGRIGDANPVLEQLPLLTGIEQARRESSRVQ